MLFSFFKPSPVIDDATRLWIFDTYLWAMQSFESDFFNHHSELILPNNAFYPGTVSSVDEMAQSIFDRTLQYVGMQHWPIRLVAPQQFKAEAMTKLSLPNKFRGESIRFSSSSENVVHPTLIDVSYNPSQVNQPQDLIAYFVQVLSSIMVQQVGVLPPGGKDFLPQSIDLVASFFGFGVLFANTAYQFKGGCGSCNNASLNREVALPEHESVYALALFCQIKAIPDKQVIPHLKSHLKKSFKRSKKDIIEQSQSGSSIALLINQSI